MAAARLTVTEDLPTPPLPDATRTTRVVGPTAVSSGRWVMFHRALAMAEDFCSAVISVHSISTLVTPGADPTRVRTSRWIWARSGQPDVVRAIVTVTWPSSSTCDVVDHAQLDDVAAQLGVDDAAQEAADVLGGGERGRGARPDAIGRAPC